MVRKKWKTTLSIEVEKIKDRACEHITREKQTEKPLYMRETNTMEGKRDKTGRDMLTVQYEV